MSGRHILRLTEGGLGLLHVHDRGKQTTHKQTDTAADDGGEAHIQNEAHPCNDYYYIDAGTELAIREAELLATNQPNPGLRPRSHCQEDGLGYPKLSWTMCLLRILLGLHYCPALRRS